jgi:TDG/mug DNA glycosylase family protein
MAIPDTPPKIGFPSEAGPNPTVLILGSFPGEQALARHEYYGNPRNHFWWIVEVLFSIDRSLPYRERIDRLLSIGIALWDAVQSCRRIGSGDDRILDAEPADIGGFLRKHPTVRYIVANGRTAERFLRRAVVSQEIDPTIEIVVMPSTSPANARSSFDEKLGQWRRILELLDGARPPDTHGSKDTT